MKKGDFYYCEICHNLVKVIDANADALVCCGEPMTLLVAHTEDAGKEKHVPVIVPEGDQTRIVLGDVPHPMTEAHYIDFIQVETKDGKIGCQYVKGQEKAEAVFNLKAEDITEVKAYCNLHGLWIKKN
ncbi:MAG: desulfoferrodoxin FeS4 iron-binding domain-containing protein [Clostridia bacterium]|nr:desulfoferrodoxin FeS4 iron-binding domain-containing protein [Clostridia bacterium]